MAGQYVDNLVQIAVNGDPIDDPEFDPTDRSIESGEITDRIRGSVISGGTYTDSKVIWYLSTKLILSIEVVGEQACGTVSQFDQQIEHIDKVETVNVRFGKELNSKVYVWPKSQLLSSRVGRKVECLFAGPMGLYLYIESSPILMFSTFIKVPEHHPVLYWEETD